MMTKDGGDFVRPRTVEELRRMLHFVKLETGAFYVAEGDLLIPADEIDHYFDTRYRGESESGSSDGSFFAELIIGAGSGGQPNFWNPADLTYAVVQASFGTASSLYQQVVANIGVAANEWERTCGVRFTHLPALDATDGMGATFRVKFTSATSRFPASAFAPNVPVSKRVLLVTSAYLTTTYDPIGIFRHELGHVLGFEHEHVRSGAPPICPGEVLPPALQLTAYDPQSVMHYFCERGGQRIGTRTLAITATDTAGSQRIYGPPR